MNQGKAGNVCEQIMVAQTTTSCKYFGARTFTPARKHTPKN